MMRLFDPIRSWRPRFRPAFGLMVLLCSGLATPLHGAAAAPASVGTNTLSARAIMARVVASSGRTNDQLILTNYHFVRWDVSEELDKKGLVTKRREKIYDHSPVRGSAVLREVREDGKPIAKSEIESQQKRDTEERKERSEKAGGDKAMVLTAEMTRRFDFVLLGTTNIMGHVVHAIRFGPSPKQDAPKNMVERVLQKVRGMVYVDATAFQIVRLEAELSDEINFWGGMLGVIKRVHILVLREPVDGIWFNRNIAGEYEARALLNTMHGRFSSTNSGFQKRDAIPVLRATPGSK